jgi:hypothetical protein
VSAGALWPDNGVSAAAHLGDVFSGEDTDPCPGRAITDRYGLVSFAADVSIVSARVLPSLGLAGDVVLERCDPEEHARVMRLAAQRARARSRVGGADDVLWLYLGALYGWWSDAVVHFVAARGSC